MFPKGLRQFATEENMLPIALLIFFLSMGLAIQARQAELKQIGVMVPVPFAAQQLIVS